jgi:hypothetical protein
VKPAASIVTQLSAILGAGEELCVIYWGLSIPGAEPMWRSLAVSASEPTANPGARTRILGMLSHAEVRGGEWHDTAAPAGFVETYTTTHGDSGSLRGSLAGPDVLIPLPSA